MISLTENEKQRWLEHIHKFTANSNRYNPNKQSDARYIFLAQEVENLGSISRVMKVHGVGRSTVHNALRFVKKYGNETRTVLTEGREAIPHPVEAL